MSPFTLRHNSEKTSLGTSMSQGQVKMTAKIDRSKQAITVSLEFKGRPIGYRPTTIFDFQKSNNNTRCKWQT